MQAMFILAFWHDQPIFMKSGKSSYAECNARTAFRKTLLERKASSFMVNLILTNV